MADCPILVSLLYFSQTVPLVGGSVAQHQFSQCTVRTVIHTVVTVLTLLNSHFVPYTFLSLFQILFVLILTFHQPGSHQFDVVGLKKR